MVGLFHPGPFTKLMRTTLFRIRLRRFLPLNTTLCWVSCIEAKGWLSAAGMVVGWVRDILGKGDGIWGSVGGAVRWWVLSGTVESEGGSESRWWLVGRYALLHSCWYSQPALQLTLVEVKCVRKTLMMGFLDLP